MVAVNASQAGNVISTGIFDMYSALGVSSVGGIRGQKSALTCVSRPNLFDALYANNSEPLKQYLNQLLLSYSDQKVVVLMTSYDDAAFHLDAEARSILKTFGFDGAERLQYEDSI